MISSVKIIIMELTKDEINLLDLVLTNELIRVEFPNGNKKPFKTDKEKKDYKILADLLRKIENASVSVNAEAYHLEQLRIGVVSFELPSDDIFDMKEVNLKNPLEEFYYYERPSYLENDQKQFRERLQKALNYLKGN